MMNNAPVSCKVLQNTIDANFCVSTEITHQEGEGGALAPRYALGKSTERSESQIQT